MRKMFFILLLFLILSSSVFAKPNIFLTKKTGVPVLLYHHILTKEENKKFKKNKNVITPELFAHQMKLLYDNGYQTITLQELENFVHKKGTVPEKSVVITFDDGYLSNIKYAYPILKKYNYRAVLFPITENIKNQPEIFNPNKLNYVSWPELPHYADVFQYEGHTDHFHRMDGKKSFLLTKRSEDILIDLELSKMLLNTRYFAYPFGQYNENTVQLLKQAGYAMAFTSRPGKVYQGSSAFTLLRYSIPSTTTTKQFKNVVGIP